MLDERAGNLMQMFAVEASRMVFLHDYQGIEADRALAEEYGVFCQIRMRESAVFYAGRDAWSKRKAPFAVIPLDPNIGGDDHES